MNLKNFEYMNKDVPFLKKEIIFRAIFTTLFFAVFIWQFVSMINKLAKNAMNVGMIISTTLVLIVCLLFCATSIMYMLKSLRIIDVIKSRGKCVSSVEILFNVKKDSFIKLYTIITEVLALVATIVLACSLTYSILQASFYSTTSFYLPLLMTIVLTAFYSVFHLTNEIKTVKNVNEFNSIY